MSKPTPRLWVEHQAAQTSQWARFFAALVIMGLMFAAGFFCAAGILAGH